jgi:hypothetical protein
MASILRVNTLTDASSNNSIAMSFVAGGSAKVLGQKNTAGTSIDATLNVSSLDDDGTGDFGINYTNSFSSTNYVASLDIPFGQSAGNSDGVHCGIETKATGNSEQRTWYGNASINATYIDWPTDLVILGDLA